MSKCGVFDFHCPVPVQLDEQWHTAVESDSKCFCFKMAALREKKQTIPGVLILSSEVSNLSLLRSKNKHKIKGQYLFYLSVCECIIPLFLLVVLRNYESVITHRTLIW